MASSESGSSSQRVFGWREWILFEGKEVPLRAKLDTGARTSCIHAEDIEPFERDGDAWVRFMVPLSRRPEDSNQPQDLSLERRQDPSPLA